MALFFEITHESIVMSAAYEATPPPTFVNDAVSLMTVETIEIAIKGSPQLLIQ